MSIILFFHRFLLNVQKTEGFLVLYLDRQGVSLEKDTPSGIASNYSCNTQYCD